MIMSKLLFFASDFKIGLSTLLADELIALYRYGIEAVSYTHLTLPTSDLV